jgi:hypothetical protein
LVTMEWPPPTWSPTRPFPPIRWPLDGGPPWLTDHPVPRWLRRPPSTIVWPLDGGLPLLTTMRPPVFPALCPRPMSTNGWSLDGGLIPLRILMTAPLRSK